MASPTTQQRIHGLIDPAILLYLAAKSYVLVLINALIWGKGALSDVRDDAFAQFWGWINPPRDPNEPLEGSAAVIEQLLPSAAGVVLELGPGNGDQIEFYLKKPAGDKISKAYGAEPCLPLHKTLLANAQAAAAAGDSNSNSNKYEIVPASAERQSLISGLTKAGLVVPGSAAGTEVFDTIICVRVLCSVENQEETCDTLYSLLKPGGKLLFCEHVINPWRTPKGSLVARLLQTVYTLLGWTFLVGNCHLTRDTVQVLVDTPGRINANGKNSSTGGNDQTKWSEVQIDSHFGWSCIPYTSGTLVK